MFSGAGNYLELPSARIPHFPPEQRQTQKTIGSGVCLLLVCPAKGVTLSKPLYLLSQYFLKSSHKIQSQCEEESGASFGKFQAALNTNHRVLINAKKAISFEREKITSCKQLDLEREKVVYFLFSWSSPIKCFLLSREDQKHFKLENVG